MPADEDIPDRETRVANMLRRAAQHERAPAGLRLQVDDLHLYGAQRGDRSRRRRLTGVPRRAAETGLALLVAAVVAVVLATTGGTSPSIAAAASLAQRGPAQAAPAPYAGAPRTWLDAHVGDLQFPNWEQQNGWRASGKRTDGLGDRSVTTVFYVKDGLQLAYSIVSAPVLKGFDPGHDRHYQTLSQHGRTIVVWKERNHTCILSAAGVSARELWRLASSER